MLISSETGSGQIVSATEDARFYDDLGCLAADWIDRHRDARAFVRVTTGQWSAVDTAFFARADVRTAMGFGVEAFATASEARQVDRERRVLTFDDVVRLTRGPR